MNIVYKSTNWLSTTEVEILYINVHSFLSTEHIFKAMILYINQSNILIMVRCFYINKKKTKKWWRVLNHFLFHFSRFFFILNNFLMRVSCRTITNLGRYRQKHLFLKILTHGREWRIFREGKGKHAYESQTSTLLGRLKGTEAAKHHIHSHVMANS